MNYKIGKLGGTFCHFISTYKCSNILQQKRVRNLEIISENENLLFPLLNRIWHIFFKCFNGISVSSMNVSETVSSIKCYTFLQRYVECIMVFSIIHVSFSCVWSSRNSRKNKKKKKVVKCITGIGDDGEQKNTQKLLTCWIVAV